MVRWLIIFICTCEPCNCVPTPPPRGGEVTPFNGLYGEAPPQRGTFFSLQVNEILGISLVEVYECVGKYAILSVKRLKRANRCILMQWKSWENVLVLWFIHDMLKTMQFTVVERDAKFYTWCVKGVSFINRRYTKGGTFLSKTVYKRVIKGSNLGVEPPRIPFL